MRPILRSLAKFGGMQMREALIEELIALVMDMDVDELEELIVVIRPTEPASAPEADPAA